MRILVLDTETTGLKSETDTLLEVAAALFDTVLRETLWSYATLLPVAIDKNPVEHINHIRIGMLKATAAVYDCDLPFAAQDGALGPILDLCDAGAVDICAAHNADFDRGFLDALASDPPLFRDASREPIPWICTRDVQFPKQKQTNALRYLAVDHGITIVEQAHRALSDVQLLCMLLRRVPDLDEQVIEALKPRALFQALVPFEKKHLAKKAGFRWNADDRRWEKRLPCDTPCDPTAKRPFPVQVVG